MYAIIRSGGKQTKVREGDVIDVERIKVGTEQVTFTPLLLVADDGTVFSDRESLDGAAVTAEIVGEHRGDKIEVFKYKNKTGYRRSQGHRQTYTTIKVTGITGPDGVKVTDTKADSKKAESKAESKKADSKKADSKKAESKKAASDEAASEKAEPAKAAPKAKKAAPKTKKAVDPEAEAEPTAEATAEATEET